jgi:hypothetical protein
MSDLGKSINGWSFEGAVNEEGIMMANKCYLRLVLITWED